MRVLVPVLVLALGCTDPPERRSPDGCGPDRVGTAERFEAAVVFRAEEDGYPMYRIPSLVQAADGTLLAFAEGRQSIEDPGAGEMDLVMKRSTDCGQSWSALEVLVDVGSDDAHNPTAVVAPDAEGEPTVWLFYGVRPPSEGGEFDLPTGLGPDSGTVWVTSSADHGVSWSEPRELTAQVKDASWSNASAGPGQAIVTGDGGILVPAWYRGPQGDGSFVFGSDDGGQSFFAGGPLAPGTNEAQLIELADGTVLLDGRQVDGAHRQVYASDDGGGSWSAPVDGLPMTPVMSGMFRTADGLVHTGVAPDARMDLRVWSSTDEAATWADETILLEGFVQYSLGLELEDGSIGLVYESASEGAFDIQVARLGADLLR